MRIGHCRRWLSHYLLSGRGIVTNQGSIMKSWICISLFLLSLVAARPAESGSASHVVSGAVDARMFRYPAVSAQDIAFVYAGDIWVVPKTGGTATRLSSPRGEEMFPRFSPDGASIAFTGNYDGNQDIYVIPTGGGLPRRLTFHGAPDRV